MREGGPEHLKTMVKRIGQWLMLSDVIKHWMQCVGPRSLKTIPINSCICNLSFNQRNDSLGLNWRKKRNVFHRAGTRINCWVQNVDKIVANCGI